MELTESSTLSFDYNSYSSSEESTTSGCEDESYKEVTYVQEGKYDSDLEEMEDPKLRNWKKWIKNRKMMMGRFKSTLNRKVNQMVMNTDDKYEKTRNANLIESIQKYRKFDKYRGDPKFWETPHYIYDICKNDIPLNCPAREKFDRTVIDNNELQTLEYIGIPNLIKFEKGLLDEPIVKKITYHKCDFLSEKMKKLKENVEVEEFVPDTVELFVTGEPLSSPTRLATPSSNELEDEFEICIDSTLLQDEEYFSHEYFPVFKVQGKVIDMNFMNTMDNDFEQVVHFVNCSINELYSEKLIIENIGNLCIRYDWSQEETYRTPGFPLRYTSQHIERFFFPSKSGIFIPGQITEIPVWFKSREPGVYHESWRLLVDPKFANNKTVKFSFQGFVRAESDKENLLKVKNYIDRCKVVSVSRNLVDTTIIDSELKNPVPYDTLFMSKDVFLHNNPNHFYESHTVQLLKDLNERITGNPDWNLSISTIRNNILTKMKTMDDKRKYLLELEKISSSLLEMNVELDVDKEKHRSVYQILCTLANKIQRESELLRPIYRIDSMPVVLGDLISVSQLSTQRGSNSSRRSRHSSSLVRKSRRSSQKVIQEESATTLGASMTENLLPIQEDLESKRLLEIRRSHYVKTLSVKTYQHLLTAIDEITAVIETLNTFLKPTNSSP